MSGKRKRYSADFKAKVALDALRGDLTTAQLVAKHFFMAAGLPAEALTFLPFEKDYQAHLEAYRLVDIALDTFPYNGTTTTCEALSMGVPVVALAGECHAGRVGASLLRRVGMERLVAAGEADYQAIALSLARDHGVLTALRLDLRPRVLRSPLGDPARLARAMEQAYHRMIRGEL